MIEPAKMHEALLKANIKLADWLEKKLVELDVDYWQNLVLPKVSYNQKLNIDRKRYTKLRQLDLAVLLRVINKNWDDLSYKFNIEGRVRNYLNEVQDIRNRYAHMSDYPSAEDFARDVDTLARFLAGIGIDNDFVSQVKLIGKDMESPCAEPDVDLRREPECEDGIELTQSQAVHAAVSVAIKEREVKVELPSSDEVRVLARDPFAPGASLIKTKMRNSGVSGYAEVEEVDGESAKSLYLSLKDVAGVPIFSGVSYAIVAKKDATDAIPIRDAKTTLDYVLAEDNVPGFEPCVAQGSPEERLIWFFGEKKVSEKSPEIPLMTTPPIARVFASALPEWWSKMANEAEFKALPPLRIDEVQHTMKLSEYDLWRYMKTYSPRSWAEAFYLVKTIDREVLDAISAPDRNLSIMDVGSGVGGALFGVLDSLAVRVEPRKRLRVVALDGNEVALKLLSGFMNTRSRDPDPCLGTTRDVELKCINRTFKEEFETPGEDRFDLIVASKSIGEDGSNSFVNFLGYAKKHLNQNGVIMLIDVLKHEQSLKDAISALGIANAEVEHLGVRVGVCGEASSDNEEVVTSVIHKNMFK